MAVEMRDFERLTVAATLAPGTQRGKSMYGAALKPQRATVIYGDEVKFDRSQGGREALEAATQAIFSAVRSLQVQSDKLRRERGL